MNGIVRVPWASQPVMPWANGGGSTRQVAIDPPDGSLQRGCRWRISRANVASGGPFSRLPGLDRSLWLLTGAGVRLDVDGRDVVLDRPYQRFDFAGEVPIGCTLLAGPCEDLNVMVARGIVAAEAAVHELTAGAVVRWRVAEQGVVVVLAGDVEARPGGVLANGDALRLDGAHALELHAARAAVLLLASFAARRV